MLQLRIKQLIWSLTSPNLLTEWVTDDAQPFCYPINEDILIELTRTLFLDDSITSLKNHNRLGKTFEQLIFFYLKHLSQSSPKPAITNLNHGVQIKTFGKHKRTLGEIDFLFHDSLNNQSIHLETAVKFYLADVNQLEQLNEQKAWVGPNRKDRLDLKINKLFSNQLTLTKQQESEQTIKNLGFDRGEFAQQFLVKGVLYLPHWVTKHPKEEINKHLPKAINTNNEFGYWIAQSHLPQLLNNSFAARTLCRDEWLTVPVAQDQLTEFNNRHRLDSNNKENLVTEIQQHFATYARPIQIIISTMDNPQNVKISRYFIVADDWSATT